MTALLWARPAFLIVLVLLAAGCVWTELRMPEER
jgi:hypothetical protein